MPDLPRPDDRTLLRVQRQEIERLNDNRMLLMACIEEMRAEAVSEIGRLRSVIEVARGKLPAKARAEVDAMLAGHGSEGQPPTP